MTENKSKSRILYFKSEGDLKSALQSAGDIPVEIVEKKNEFAIEVPANEVLFFQGLGSINFGITVGEA